MIHSRLRSETAAAHARLEEAVGLMRPDLPLSHYGAVLQGFHAFHRSVEPALAAALVEPAFLAPRMKLAWLDADLAALGLAPAVAPVAAEPLVTDRASAMGVLYVMEGATLGGRLIARHLLDRLGLCPMKGARYFGGYGQETGQRWREFLSRLDTPWLQARSERVVRAALATFELLEDRLPRFRLAGGAGHG